MFRVLTCPSSGGKIVFTQHLLSSLSVNICTVHWLRADCNMLTRVWQQLEYRIDVCRVTRGAHIEHL
jgi:hypothetical protein